VISNSRSEEDLSYRENYSEDKDGIQRKGIRFIMDYEDNLFKFMPDSQSELSLYKVTHRITIKHVQYYELRERIFKRE
jgi:hypothetical protein